MRITLQKVDILSSERHFQSFSVVCILDQQLVFSPVNLGFDLEQIATEMIFAGSNSLNSAS